jgi:hypothetical protein
MRKRPLIGRSSKSIQKCRRGVKEECGNQGSNERLAACWEMKYLKRLEE